MNRRIAPFTLLTLSAAISTDLLADISATSDSISLTPNQTQVLHLLANDTLNGESIPADRVFITQNYGSDFIDTNGQEVDPFDGNQISDFVIVDICSDDLAHGSVTLDANGNVLYTPDEDYAGGDSMWYHVEEYDVLLNDAGYAARYVDSSSTTVVFDIANGESQNNLTALVSGQNRQRVARAITQVCNESGGQTSARLQSRCAELNELQSNDPGSLQDIIAHITPDEILSLRRLSAEASRQHLDLVYRQILNRRRQESDQQVTLNDNEFSLLNVNGGNAGDSSNHWSGFASVQYDESGFSGDDLEDPYDTETSSITFGADYRPNRNWLTGLALAWSEQDVAYNKTAGNLDATLHNIIGYASYMNGAINLDMQFGLMQADQYMRRNIVYSGINTSTSADTKTRVLNASSQVDYNWPLQHWNLRPYVRLDYLRAQIDGFRETGGMGWAVEAGDQDMSQWNSSIGLDTSYAMSFAWGVLLPGFNLSVISQSSKDYKPVEFQFIENDSSAGNFTLLTQGEDNLFYQYELNAVAVLARGGSAFISYRSVMEFDDMESDQITLGGRYEF